jgi:hypothetical protein
LGGSHRFLCALALMSLPAASALAEGIGESSPLVEKVRHATARFLNINVALAEGWVLATPCVSGPDTGAMGCAPGAPRHASTMRCSIGEPNRFGLPAFYELHVWAWEQNPRGTPRRLEHSRHLRPPAGERPVSP